MATQSCQQINPNTLQVQINYDLRTSMSYRKFDALEKSSQYIVLLNERNAMGL